ncbi:hypothetical protein [Maritalea myrionectae]|uniref:hypothetical protein n=1 Tax=Maritalea myrionectae TaxID=454601 RepID=UPI0005636373|nr:hypothetical protein [Maritalea myrionectae]
MISIEDVKSRITGGLPENIADQVNELNQLHPDVVTSLLMSESTKAARIQVYVKGDTSKMVQKLVAIAWLSATRYQQDEIKETITERQEKIAKSSVYAAIASVVFAFLLVVSSATQAWIAFQKLDDRPEAYPPVISPPVASVPPTATQ